MRLADYVCERLHQAGCRHAFMLTGGGAMHLNDAFGRHPGLQKVFCHHEQALTMAADAYFRVSGKVAAINVTTGPGGVNALNGVYGAYVDSVPMIVISGQVRTDTISKRVLPGLRQFGDQEVDIVEMVRPITKYAVCLEKATDIFEVLEKAIFLATDGRPGPVWVDIPLDLQGAPIEVPASIEMPLRSDLLAGAALEAEVDALVERLKTAKRPVILAGNGVRFSGHHQDFLSIIGKLGIPVTTVWNSYDLIWNDHPCYAGRPGADGERAGNFSIQSSDLLLILGTRMAIRQVGFNHKSFAREAYRVMVDADPFEMKKPILRVDQPIQANLANFLPLLDRKLDGWNVPAAHREYMAWCAERVAKYPVVQPHHLESAPGTINPYAFVDALFDELSSDDLIVTGDGTAAVVTFKAAKVKKGQRLFTNKGCASMGFDLPAAIGAAHASPGRRVICITGDGSIMMNLQELQTIAGNDLPITVFLLNNDGYHSIRQAQHGYFNGYEVGCGPTSGLSFPDFGKVANAFGFRYELIDSLPGLRERIRTALPAGRRQIIEVRIDKSQLFEPRVASQRLPNGSMVSAPFELMTPLLPPEEAASNLLIPAWENT